MCMDLHRHDEHSSFDGFGKATENARLAKKQGLTALGIANHGNMNGVVEHWMACKQEGIKPILGVEAYFQPKFDRKNPSSSSFHLCIFARNLEGYKNLNRIMTAANLKQKYRKPLVDFPLLEKYGEGLIMTSGCIASFISQTILKGKFTIAKKAIKKFASIVGKENFYIEIQPYAVSEEGLQEKINIKLIEFAKEMKLPMVLTSDSHYGNKEDYDTYMKMHEIKESDDFAGNTYEERYMPNKLDLFERFIKMHKKDFKAINSLARKIEKDMKRLEESVEEDILGQLPLVLPKISDDDSSDVLKRDIIKGLKDRGHYNKEYMKRCMAEYEVIKHHGFDDYFLIVADYVKYAKRRYDLVDQKTAMFWDEFIEENNYPEEPMKVGPGRGSVCNSAVAYALGITEVDSHYFDLDFTRFLRMDKKKLPDVDLDFETDRRDEVIHYIVKKYKGHAAQICSYGLYKVDNLLNDLAKVCEVGHTEYDEKGKEKFVVDKDALKRIKAYVNANVIDDEFHYENISHQYECRHFDKQYNNIIKHFGKMFKKVKYIGTHAAGVAVVGGQLLDYTSLESRGGKVNKETGKREGDTISTAYDLNNLEAINVIKFDMLGLRTLSITKELEEMTDECFSYEWLEDESIYEYFAEGKTDGIFQFERGTAKDILKKIQTDSFRDVVAASALNRPGPLSLKMPDQYAHHKLEGNYGGEAWSDFTDKTYGTIVYQEQITAICREIGLLDASEADKVLKFMKGTQMTESAIRTREREEKQLREKFRAGAKKTRNLSKAEADDLFDKITVYSFNEGHSTGYSLISLQQMYFKVKHPELFWYVTLKYANEGDLYRLKMQAVKEGNIILLPHVNYKAKYSIVTIEGENALAEGLSNVKNVGEKAAVAIEQERAKNGKFKNKEDFLNRVPKRQVNAKVIRALEESGALVFDKKVYFDRVQKYNATLFSKSF